MEIQVQLRELADKVSQIKKQINTEEATKTAFVLPFIKLLGYDIFNPIEVVPEYTADIGLKKGEKVDYAIVHNELPTLIIECKHWKENLDLHNSQLLRYYHTSDAQFALLTNGVDFRFYSDLEKRNKMDEKPFLEFDITKLKDSAISEITKFHKSNFDVDKIKNNASSLKYTKEIKKILNREIEDSSPEFVKLLASQVYKGHFTKKAASQFKDLVNKAFNQLINETVNDRIQSALNKETEKQKADQELEVVEESKIITTEEEIEAYNIVVAILRRKTTKDRISHRDKQSYFGILFDDNNRKPICRLITNKSSKYIILFDENKNETKHLLNSIDEIYDYQDELLKTVDYYLS